MVGPSTQQQPCTPTGVPNHQVCHWNPNPVQLLLPTANPPSNAFWWFTLATRRLSTVPGTSVITSEHLLLGPKTTFRCPQKAPLRSFFTTFHPKLGLVPLNVTSLWVVAAQQAIQSCVAGPSTQQHSCTPTGLPNHQVCHRNPNPVQFLLPTANPPNNAFCVFTMATRALSTIPGNSGMTSEHLFPGPETTFWCHLGTPKGRLRSFFTTFHPKHGLVPLNVTYSWIFTTLQTIQSCVVGPSTQQQPCTPTTGIPNHQVCHRNPNPVQLLLPTANPPNNAFCGFTLASIRLNNISITSGVTSEHLLLGLETTFWCHLGPPKGPLRSFSPPTTPNLDLCH